MEQSKLQSAVKFYEARTAGHRAVPGKRCGCGPCLHWLHTAARRAGVTPAELVAALPPAAKAEPPRRRRAGRPGRMRAQICESGSIRPRGSNLSEAAGLAALFERLHREE